MANKLTDMSKVRKVIQLHHQKRGKLFISKYLSISRNTVKKYIALYQLLDLSIEDINQRSDAELEEMFNLINRLLKEHLKDTEYHHLFLKDDH